jgi:hypothetical protein
MKKKFFLLIVVITTASLAIAQSGMPVRKIHAYKQASIPGILPVIIDSEGNKIREERKLSYNYWFYIEVKKTDKISIADLWIAGKRYSAKTETVDRLPVEKIIYTAATNNDTVLLAPVTSNKVLLTYPATGLKDSVIRSKYLSDLISENELVIGYFWKGKKYFRAVKTLKTLEPEARQ